MRAGRAFVLGGLVAGFLLIPGPASAEGIDPSDPIDTGWGPSSDVLPDAGNPTDTGWGPAAADYTVGLVGGSVVNTVVFVVEQIDHL
jgi:hypothetical protein